MEEFEITFRVISEDPEAVFRDISATASIGPYRIVFRDTGIIHDRYFDTQESDLGKKMYALRLRTKGEDSFLCLKGREHTNEWGGISRLEIEATWSEEILGRIARETGLILLEDAAGGTNDPVEALKIAGFSIIQSREIVRTLFDVIPDDSRRSAIGEMALDRVCYEFRGKRLVHYEVEVEATGNEPHDTLKDYVAFLKQTFPGMLKRWDHNKLVTGIALGTLIEKGDLPFDSRENDLIPLAWYGVIEKEINRVLCCSRHG